MEFGLVLSQINTKWEYLVSDARAAEEVGLDSVWVIDHLLGPLGPDAPIFEGWTALSVVAGLTGRVRLGQLVTCVSFRNVGLLAKMAATLDHASGGRLELGLGAGWYEEEYRSFGYPFPSPGERRRALEETIDALRLLFEGGPVDLEGEFVRLAGARCLPVPVQRPSPPITVGAGGPLMRRLAGKRADAWNCPAALLPDLARARQVVTEAAGDRPVRTTLQIPVAVGRTREEVEAARETARVHLAWTGDVEEIGLVGTVDEAAERVAAYREAGADGFLCLLPGSPRRPGFIEALGELARTVRS